MLGLLIDTVKSSYLLLPVNSAKFIANQMEGRGGVLGTDRGLEGGLGYKTGDERTGWHGERR
jgi:hypothetical protein